MSEVVKAIHQFDDIEEAINYLRVLSEKKGFPVIHVIESFDHDIGISTGNNVEVKSYYFDTRALCNSTNDLLYVMRYVSDIIENALLDMTSSETIRQLSFGKMFDWLYLYQPATVKGRNVIDIKVKVNH